MAATSSALPPRWSLGYANTAMGLADAADAVTHASGAEQAGAMGASQSAGGQAGGSSSRLHHQTAILCMNIYPDDLVRGALDVPVGTSSIRWVQDSSRDYGASTATVFSFSYGCVRV